MHLLADGLSFIKKKVEIRMNLEDIILSKISQTEKVENHRVSLIFGIWRQTHRQRAG